MPDDLGLSYEQIGFAAGADQAHTTNTAVWNSQAGTARQVLAWDGTAWVGAYLTAIDVLEPAQVTGFTVEPSAIGTSTRS